MKATDRFRSIHLLAPIVCCQCGRECQERGEIYARRIGWHGFSAALVRQSDGLMRRERLGCCSSCLDDMKGVS